MQKRIDDLVEMSEKNGRIYTSDFYPAEKIRSIKLHGNFVLSGGTEDAEREVFFALPHYVDSKTFDVGDFIKCIKIIPSDKAQYSHRDYLGSIMALGIDRDKLGDIIVNDGGYVLGFEQMIKYITLNLKSVSRTSCHIVEVPLNEIPNKICYTQRGTVSVSSRRLDCIIGGVFNVSRERARELVENGFAVVNKLSCQKSEKQIEIGDIIGVKGFGRCRVLDYAGQSRKGKERIEFEIYK